MSFEKHKILERLHDDIWELDLLGELFNSEFERLSSREKLILEEKVAGKSDKEIADYFKLTEKTILRHTYNIKEKYRNNLRSRVDNYYEVQKFKKYTEELVEIVGEKHREHISMILNNVFRLGISYKTKFYKKR